VLENVNLKKRLSREEYKLALPRGFKMYPVTAARTYEQQRPWLWRFWLKVPNRGEMASFDQGDGTNARPTGPAGSGSEDRAHRGGDLRGLAPQLHGFCRWCLRPADPGTPRPHTIRSWSPDATIM
jgi:hypothetical protein